jgi:hypothetical protein
MNSRGVFDAIIPFKRDTCLPRYVTKKIKVVDVDVGNAKDSTNTRGKKQCGNVPLMTLLLESSS